MWYTREFFVATSKVENSPEKVGKGYTLCSAHPWPGKQTREKVPLPSYHEYEQQQSRHCQYEANSSAFDLAVVRAVQNVQLVTMIID
jgi:hypothetical protein